MSRTSSYEGAAGLHEKLARLNVQNAPLLSPFDSPPASPAGKTNPYFPDHHAPTHKSRSARSSVSRYSAASGSGSDTDTESCDNCMFLVPKAVGERLPEGAPGSPVKDGKGQHGSPVLRTTQAITARGAPGDFVEGSHHHRRNDILSSAEDLSDPLATSDSMPSSTSSATSPQPYPPTTHTHKLSYITTKQPLSPISYSFLRRACIRTLSNETLPKGSPSGPLFFGDPHAGYTIAYVFRVPDPRARGKRRMYALLALGGRDAWRVSKVYVHLTKIFESIANQIIAMADAVISRETQQSPGALENLAPLSSSLPPPTEPLSPVPAKERAVKSATTSPTVKNRRFDNTSSFLTGKRVDPDGHPRLPSDMMKAKGLAEIVGKEDFFVELHARFCVVLSSLVKEMAVR